MKDFNPMTEQIIDNLRQIIADKHITQAALADFGNMEQSDLSRFLNRKIDIKINTLANIASGLGMSLLDVFTYPDVYVPKTPTTSPVKASVTLELSPTQRDSVLSLLFGDDKAFLLKNS